MPKEETPRNRKLYTEPSWALEYLKGVEQREVIEKGHERLGTLRDVRPFNLSEGKRSQLRDEVDEAMPGLKNSGLTLKQKMTLLRIREKNRTRKIREKNRTRKQEGKTRRRVR